MADFLFTNGAGWFAVPALIGSAVFLISVTLMLVGGHIGAGHAGGFDNVDFHAGDPGHSDSSEAFKILSVQGVAAFLMGFGWGGLGALKGTGWPWPASAIIALACGVAMVWLLAALFNSIRALQSSGTIAIDAAAGREGEVYATVPAAGKGRGQVRVTIDDRQRIYNAVGEDGDLPTGTRVRVTRVNQDNTLTVRAI